MRKSNSASFHGTAKAEKLLKDLPRHFDNGPLNKVAVFRETQPEVMKDWIARFNWGHQLQYTGTVNKNRPVHKHERFKYRMLSFMEQKLLNGRLIGGFKNYRIIRK